MCIRDRGDKVVHDRVFQRLVDHGVAAVFDDHSLAEEYTKINEYLTELKKCVDHVKISAEDYNSCEQQIYSMVESISCLLYTSRCV